VTITETARRAGTRERFAAFLAERHPFALKPALAAFDRGADIEAAQAYCSNVAVHAAEECIQQHGGIGMTWEYPAHLYLKRAKSDQLALGTAYRHRARLAELIDLPLGR